MIVMLNGSFGVGKTSTARALVERLPGTIVFDPELVGSMVRAITEGIRSGPEDTDDYQDIAVWRSLTVETACQIYRRYKRPLIVPMTLANPAYLDEIRAGFARITPRLCHFCLVAPLETVHARLRERGEAEGSWAFRKAARYVPVLDGPRFREHVDTVGRSPAEIAERIVESLCRDAPDAP